MIIHGAPTSRRPSGCPASWRPRTTGARGSPSPGRERPGQPADTAISTRDRRVRDQRPEDLDLLRPPGHLGPVPAADRPHRISGATSTRGSPPSSSTWRPRVSNAADPGHGRRRVQRGLLHRRAIPANAAWATRAMAGWSPWAPSATSGSASPRRWPSWPRTSAMVEAARSVTRARSTTLASGPPGPGLDQIELARLLSLRALSKVLKGEKTWPEGPLAKLQSYSLRGRSPSCIRPLGPVGPWTGCPRRGGRGHVAHLTPGRGTRLGGGTTEVQKNIIADRAIAIPGKSAGRLSPRSSQLPPPIPAPPASSASPAAPGTPPKGAPNGRAPQPLAMWERLAHDAARAGHGSHEDHRRGGPTTARSRASTWSTRSPGSTTTAVDPPGRERIGSITQPRRRYSGIGGSVPLTVLATEVAGEDQGKGDHDLALITGAEALATVRQLKKAGEKPQWSFRPRREAAPRRWTWSSDRTEVSHAVFEGALDLRPVRQRPAGPPRPGASNKHRAPLGPGARTDDGHRGDQPARLQPRGPRPRRVVDGEHRTTGWWRLLRTRSS